MIRIFPAFSRIRTEYGEILHISPYSVRMQEKKFSLTAIWLPNGQLWAIIEGTDSLTNVNHCVLRLRPEGHREPCSEVESLSPAERLVGFEPGTFRFLLQRSNPLGHSPGKIRTRITATPNTDTFYAVAFTKLK